MLGDLGVDVDKMDHRFRHPSAEYWKHLINIYKEWMMAKNAEYCERHRNHIMDKIMDNSASIEILRQEQSEKFSELTKDVIEVKQALSELVVSQDSSREEEIKDKGAPGDEEIG